LPVLNRRYSSYHLEYRTCLSIRSFLHNFCWRAASHRRSKLRRHLLCQNTASSRADFDAQVSIEASVRTRTVCHENLSPCPRPESAPFLPPSRVQFITACKPSTRVSSTVLYSVRFVRQNSFCAGFPPLLLTLTQKRHGRQSVYPHRTRLCRVLLPCLHFIQLHTSTLCMCSSSPITSGIDFFKKKLVVSIPVRLSLSE
jgi:hypothetical protein